VTSSTALTNEGQLAQGGIIAKAPHCWHPEFVGIYHESVRLSLEPDCPYLGLM